MITYDIGYSFTAPNGYVQTRRVLIASDLEAPAVNHLIREHRGDPFFEIEFINHDVPRLVALINRDTVLDLS